MALSLNSFAVGARDSHANARIEVESGAVAVKGSGFFSRWFTRNRGDAGRNRETVDAFVAAVREQRGEMAARNVSSLLFADRAAGKPLRARAVREMLARLEWHERNNMDEALSFVGEVRERRGDGPALFVEKRLDAAVNSGVLLTEEMKAQAMRAVDEEAAVVIGEAIRDVDALVRGKTGESALAALRAAREKLVGEQAPAGGYLPRAVWLREETLREIDSRLAAAPLPVSGDAAPPGPAVAAPAPAVAAGGPAGDSGILALAPEQIRQTPTSNTCFAMCLVRGLLNSEVGRMHLDSLARRADDGLHFALRGPDGAARDELVTSDEILAHRLRSHGDDRPDVLVALELAIVRMMPEFDPDYKYGNFAFADCAGRMLGLGQEYIGENRGDLRAFFDSLPEDGDTFMTLCNGSHYQTILRRVEDGVEVGDSLGEPTSVWTMERLDRYFLDNKRVFLVTFSPVGL